MIAATFIAALCAVSAAGDFDCYDTGFESADYIDCTDQPEPPIGSTSERGGGWIAIGVRGPDGFVADRSWLYAWSGRQEHAGGVVFALVGIDDDRLFGDEFDARGPAGHATANCVAGRFNP